ncbi:MAG TPA: hypothetical protein PLQ76_03930, partial [bacterium]|nr:hypothetical protein [bacterium]
MTQLVEKKHRSSAPAIPNQKNRAVMAGIIMLAAALRLPVFLHPHLGMESIYPIVLRNSPVSDMITAATSCGLAPIFYVITGLWARISDSEQWILIIPVIMN